MRPVNINSAAYRAGFRAFGFTDCQSAPGRFDIDERIAWRRGWFDALEASERKAA